MAIQVLMKYELFSRLLFWAPNKTSCSPLPVWLPCVPLSWHHPKTGYTNHAGDSTQQFSSLGRLMPLFVCVYACRVVSSWATGLWVSMWANSSGWPRLENRIRYTSTLSHTITVGWAKSCEWFRRLAWDLYGLAMYTFIWNQNWIEHFNHRVYISTQTTIWILAIYVQPCHVMPSCSFHVAQSLQKPSITSSILTELWCENWFWTFHSPFYFSRCGALEVCLCGQWGLLVAEHMSAQSFQGAELWAGTLAGDQTVPLPLTWQVRRKSYKACFYFHVHGCIIITITIFWWYSCL